MAGVKYKVTFSERGMNFPRARATFYDNSRINLTPHERCHREEFAKCVAREESEER